MWLGAFLEWSRIVRRVEQTVGVPEIKFSMVVGVPGEGVRYITHAACRWFVVEGNVILRTAGDTETEIVGVRHGS